LDDYYVAIVDCKYAIDLNLNNSDAYFVMGIEKDGLSNRNDACKDRKTAVKLSNKAAALG
jgi:hypothetical protein